MSSFTMRNVEIGFFWILLYFVAREVEMGDTHLVQWVLIGSLILGFAYFRISKLLHGESDKSTDGQRVEALRCDNKVKSPKCRSNCVLSVNEARMRRQSVSNLPASNLPPRGSNGTSSTSRVRSARNPLNGKSSAILPAGNKISVRPSSVSVRNNMTTGALQQKSFADDTLIPTIDLHEGESLPIGANASILSNESMRARADLINRDGKRVSRIAQYTSLLSNAGCYDSLLVFDREAGDSKHDDAMSTPATIIEESERFSMKSEMLVVSEPGLHDPVKEQDGEMSASTRMQSTARTENEQAQMTSQGDAVGEFQDVFGKSLSARHLMATLDKLPRSRTQDMTNGVSSLSGLLQSDTPSTRIPVDGDHADSREPSLQTGTSSENVLDPSAVRNQYRTSASGHLVNESRAELRRSLTPEDVVAKYEIAESKRLGELSDHIEAVGNRCKSPAVKQILAHMSTSLLGESSGDLDYSSILTGNRVTKFPVQFVSSINTTMTEVSPSSSIGKATILDIDALDSEHRQIETLVES